VPAIADEIDEGPISDVHLPHDLPSLRRRPSRASQDRWSRTRWLLIAAAVLLPVIGFLVVYLILGSDDKRPDSREPQHQTIRVADGMALFHAIRVAKPNARIVVTANIEACNINVTVRDLTIEAEPGKEITWSCIPDAPKDYKLLLVSAAGFQLRGFTLDGGNKIEALISLHGKCPGLKLEKLELKNFPNFGVLLTNCEGSEDSPGKFVDLAFHTSQPAQSAIRFNLQSNFPNVTKNRYFSFQNCTFKGPGKKITTPDLSFIDKKTLSLPPNLDPEQSP
jgi:hypothetical protein